MNTNTADDFHFFVEFHDPSELLTAARNYFASGFDHMPDGSAKWFKLVFVSVSFQQLDDASNCWATVRPLGFAVAVAKARSFLLRVLPRNNN